MADSILTSDDLDQSLKRPLKLEETEETPKQTIFPEDSATTKAEKVERNGTMGSDEPASKRVKLEELEEDRKVDSREKVKGIALVKPEYLIDTYKRSAGVANPNENDDAAEGRTDDRSNGGKKKKKEKGQNKERQFGQWFDAIRLCSTRQHSPEFSPKFCKFGDKCNQCHDLRKYLKEGKTGDLETFEGKCPVWEVNGKCHAGWKCRFAKSHSKEIELEDGRKELVLIEDPARAGESPEDDDDRKGIYNVVKTGDKLALAKRQIKTPKSDQYSDWLEKDAKEMDKIYHQRRDREAEDTNGVGKKKADEPETNGTNEKKEAEVEKPINSSSGQENPQTERVEVSEKKDQVPEITKVDVKTEKEENRARFIDPPFLPSEKRRIYFGPETPVLAPLTTQGNLPFRRMCVDFGAQITYSEMALSMPLIQGQKPEWALMKAHESELSPPQYQPKSVVQNYDNTKDLKFGAQISANKPWNAMKAAEVLTKLVPHLRVIDLNCGCPIELVCRQGAGSALLDSPSKLEKMIRGMSAVSGEIPITAKIRMGTRDAKPTAFKTIERLAFGGAETRDRLGAPGCAALTLHGRSKQQRYTKSADWSYIADCAALIKSYHDRKDELTDTINETDARTQANTPDGKMFFIGNGDCYSHSQYFDDIQNSGVDSVMVARGALIKPWIFEEIEKGQYLDKSASERLGYVERFVRYGLEAWGSDEVGVGTTRRFLLEWLSFAHRYVPVGILAHLPPSLQDRPPAYRGRSDLETLLASDNYLDWIKISEMFLGPSHKDFKFQPKHKSNSYEIEAEG